VRLRAAVTVESMKRRVVLVVALGLGLAGLRPVALPAQAAGPPVLLITIDTLRQDTTGTYGGPAATPALSALAARGVRFDNAVAHAVMTLPSHTSILTGLDPSRHGVHDNIGFRASDVLDTWAERLKAAGYSTGAFVGAFPLDSRFGLAQGFDTYDDFYGGFGANEYRLAERPAVDVVARAREWIQTAGDTWFAWVHVYDPHAPYAPPSPFAEQYPRDPYAGEVAYTDAALKPLLADAERMGALVIVTSDHGEARGDHGELTHGILAYNSTIRVPLIVAGPEVAAGAVAARRVGHADLLPTVLDQLGLDQGSAQGTSFADVLRSGRDAGLGEELVYFEALNANLTRNWAPLRGVFRGPWKFIDLPLPELYDVLQDPHEAEELSRSRGSMMVELSRALAGHLEGASAADAPLAEDPETMRQLRSLGYLGGRGGGSREYGPEDDPKNLVHLDAQVQQAILELEAGNLEGAVARLDGVLAERADFVPAIGLAASAEFSLNRREAALTRLRNAAQQPWATGELRQDLGFYLHAAGRLDEAREVLQRVVSDEPGNVDALNVLSLVERDAGRAAAAMQLVDRALAIDPTYAELHVNRGELLLRAGRVDEATRTLETALTYDPGMSSAHNMLGAIAFDENRLDAAFAHWRTAIENNPGDYDAMRNLGIKLVQANRFAEAVEVLEQLFAAVPVALEREYQIPQLRDMVRRIRSEQGIR
jgi:arylsulfatase A-like enzyme/tetratricopeptide (TPR) repeat protein